MYTIDKYPDGIFAWVDLATPDIAGAKAFYSQLFGWELRDLPLPGGGSYTNAYIDGRTVAGMGEMQADMKAQGVPAYWTSYVKHDDADALAGRVAAAGGAVLVPPMDVMDEGRMAIFADPTGAVWGVWQPKNHTGAQVVNSPNSLVWNELQTHDTEAAGAFYEQVFGWGREVSDGYIAFTQDGRAHAGGMAIRPEWGDVPANWSVYFLADDLAAAVARVRALGGQVHNEFELPGMGAGAVVADPQGGVFTLVHYPADVIPPPPSAE